MRAGDKLRFIGPAGAPFVVTVGEVFGERIIRAYVESGEWTPLDPKPAAKPAVRKKAAAKKRVPTPVEKTAPQDDPPVDE